MVPARRMMSNPGRRGCLLTTASGAIPPRSAPTPPARENRRAGWAAGSGGRRSSLAGRRHFRRRGRAGLCRRAHRRRRRRPARPAHYARRQHWRYRAIDDADQRGGTPNAPAIYDSVEPSVVGLSVSGDSGLETGSGVVVSSSGPTCYVLTDSSLFSGATSSTAVGVMSYLGEQVNGHLVGTDPSAGIAVVRADLCVRTGRYPAVTGAQPGTVADVQTGEEVFSIGSTAEAASTNVGPFARVRGRRHELPGAREWGV